MPKNYSRCPIAYYYCRLHCSIPSSTPIAIDFCTTFNYTLLPLASFLYCFLLNCSLLPCLHSTAAYIALYSTAYFTLTLSLPYCATTCCLLVFEQPSPQTLQILYNSNQNPLRINVNHLFAPIATAKNNNNDIFIWGFTEMFFCEALMPVTRLRRDATTPQRQ